MLSIPAIAILPILAHYVSAQAPACLAGYEWTYNSQNQTPCEMVVALGGACVTTPFILPTLTPGETYIGPTQLSADSCRCSSVYYSLLCACSLCQGGDYIDWDSYKANCTAVFDQVFPDPIPTGFKIPHYAYLSVDAEDEFDATLAMTAVGPESTPVSQPTTTATATATSAARNSKSKAGPIAGGVIGGVAFLAILAGLIAVILRYRKRKQSGHNYDAPEPAMSYGNVKYNDNSFVPTSLAPGKIYDPNDPSTFPTNDSVTLSSSPDYLQQRATITPTFTGSGTIASTPAGAARAHYTGAPEL